MDVNVDAGTDSERKIGQKYSQYLYLYSYNISFWGSAVPVQVTRCVLRAKINKGDRSVFILDDLEVRTASNISPL